MGTFSAHRDTHCRTQLRSAALATQPRTTVSLTCQNKTPPKKPVRDELRRSFVHFHLTELLFPL